MHHFTCERFVCVHWCRIMLSCRKLTVTTHTAEVWLDWLMGYQYYFLPSFLFVLAFYISLVLWTWRGFLGWLLFIINYATAPYINPTQNYITTTSYHHLHPNRLFNPSAHLNVESEWWWRKNTNVQSHNCRRPRTPPGSFKACRALADGFSWPAKSVNGYLKP